MLEVLFGQAPFRQALFRQLYTIAGSLMEAGSSSRAGAESTWLADYILRWLSLQTFSGLAVLTSGHFE